MAQRPPAAVTEHDPPLAAPGDDEDMAAVRRIFRDVTAAFGIDGAPVFERLAAGQSVAQALSVSPAVVDVLYARAHGWSSLGRVDRAQTLFRALCLLDERNADYWVGYGVCLRMAPLPDSASRSERARQYDSARKAFEAAALLRPDWAIPHFHALELSLFLRRWDQARACLVAYEERMTPEIPLSIVQEAQRLRAILETRQAAASPAPGVSVSA
ncbi:hypothetical protein ACUSIJ_07580 [Pseudochelatococcus sp. B33]